MLWLWAAFAGAAAGQPDDPEAVIRSPVAGEVERVAAARALLEAEDPADLSVLHLALLEDFPRGSRVAVARAMAASGVAPTAMAPAIAAGLAAADADELPPLLDAARLLTRREVVGAVVGVLERDPPVAEPVRRSAIQALRRQTGLDLAGDPARWLAWWRDGDDLEDAAWYADLAQLQLRRVRTLEDRAARQAGELEGAYRRMHALTPEAERGALIAELVRSDIPSKRDIGFELALRALMSARTPGEDVLEASAASLASRDRSTRLRAAMVLDRSAAGGYGAAALAALRGEEDEAVAAPLLGVLARDPQPNAGWAVVKWSEVGGVGAEAARAAALAMIEAETLTDRTQIVRLVNGVAGALERGGPGEVSLTGARLLAIDQRWDALESLLSSEREDLALASAEALAGVEARWRAVVEAAGTRAALFAPAARAILLHDPSARGLVTVAALPTDDESAREASLRAVALRLDPEELLNAAAGIGDASRRFAALEAAASPDRLRALEDEGAAARMIEAVAIAAVEADQAAWLAGWSPTIPEEVGGSRGARARVVALLCVDRIDAAASLAEAAGVRAGAWLEACDRVGEDAALRSRIAADAIDRFEDSGAELEALRAFVVEEEAGASQAGGDLGREPAAEPAEEPDAAGG